MKKYSSKAPRNDEKLKSKKVVLSHIVKPSSGKSDSRIKRISLMIAVRKLTDYMKKNIKGKL